MTSVINNAELYMQLLNAAEQAQRCGYVEQEESILEEMDELWKEMSRADKDEVDNLMGYQIGC